MKGFLKSWKSSWKMERLKFQNLWFVKMKKFRLHLLLTVGKDFATEFHLSIHQTLRFNKFNVFGKLNLKCDCKLKLTSLPFFWEFLYKRFEFNLVCTEFQNLKDFLRLYSQFENKKGKNENLFAMPAFLYALLSYAFSFEAKISFVNRCICVF